MSFAKDMKAKIDDLEIERHLKELADETEKAANEAVEKAGGLAHERRDEIAGWVDKATGKLNEQTKGQYADKVDKVRTGLLSGLDKLASKRRLGDPVAPIEPPSSVTQTDVTQTDVTQTDVTPSDVTPPDVTPPAATAETPDGPPDPTNPPKPFA